MEQKAKAGFDCGFNREYLHLIEICGLNYKIIWLVDNVSTLENSAHYNLITSELELHLGLQDTQNYDSVPVCIDQLRNATDRSIILFICRDEPLNAGDFPTIQNLPRVEYIYELGSDNPCRKIGGKIFDNVDQLRQVESDLHIIPPNLDTTSIDHFDPELKEYFITQLLMEVLQKLPYTERERKRFLFISIFEIMIKQNVFLTFFAKRQSVFCENLLFGSILAIIFIVL